ncbi:MAG: helix-hairpin-helix domain-containing protein, partial [Deltaproteobacteria bacterium]|nr:helix-hairpin-helix domain-containing protein [Deltaproteobacteria bacterium]
AAVEKAVSLASAVSINVESPKKSAFEKLTDRKNYERDIVHPVKLISRLTAPGERYSRVKQTTQFIVGASDETDLDLVTATKRLYSNLRLDRVYYSAYQRGLGNPAIPGEKSTDEREAILTREHRLYQVDFLFRQYKWSIEDIAFNDGGKLSLDKDPKEIWAERHPEFFPVCLNKADKEELLRVPGLGPVSANLILKMRKNGKIHDMKQAGFKGKRLEKVKNYAILD